MYAYTFANSVVQICERGKVRLRKLIATENIIEEA